MCPYLWQQMLIEQVMCVWEMLLCSNPGKSSLNTVNYKFKAVNHTSERQQCSAPSDRRFVGIYTKMQEYFIILIIGFLVIFRKPLGFVNRKLHQTGELQTFLICICVNLKPVNFHLLIFNFCLQFSRQCHVFQRPGKEKTSLVCCNHLGRDSINLNV